MATAVVTLRFCDRHLTEKDEEVSAEPMPPIDGYDLDLCAECAAPIMEALAMYQQFGSKGQRTKRMRPRAAAAPAADSTGALTCPRCEGKTFVSRASLGAHARQQHGISLGELEGRPVTHTCATCGRGFTNGSGLARHQRAKHPAA